MRGNESSIQMPAPMARVDPLMLEIFRSERSPPELPHWFSPLVINPSIFAPSTTGAEYAPMERPIPYLHVVEVPCTSCPPPSMTRSLIVGEALLNRSTATLSALRTVRLETTGSLP